MLWAHEPIKNLTVTDNVIKSGVTTGFMIEGASNTIIENNFFDSNLANGLALIKGGSDVIIRVNHFISNPLLVSSDVLGVLVENNAFTETSNGMNPIKVKSNVSLIENKVRSSPVTHKPILEVYYGSEKIEFGSEFIVPYEVLKNSIMFRIINSGEKVLSLYGFPQVIITEKVLPDKSRGPRISGQTNYSGLSVLSQNQPKSLTIKPSESTSFHLTRSQNKIDKGTELIVNIPNSATYPAVYWFKLKITH